MHLVCTLLKEVSESALIHQGNVLSERKLLQRIADAQSERPFRGTQKPLHPAASGSVAPCRRSGESGKSRAVEYFNLSLRDHFSSSGKLPSFAAVAAERATAQGGTPGTKHSESSFIGLENLNRVVSPNFSEKIWGKSKRSESSFIGLENLNGGCKPKTFRENRPWQIGSFSGLIGAFATAFSGPIRTNSLTLHRSRNRPKGGLPFGPIGTLAPFAKPPARFPRVRHGKGNTKKLFGGPDLHSDIQTHAPG